MELQEDIQICINGVAVANQRLGVAALALLLKSAFAGDPVRLKLVEDAEIALTRNPIETPADVAIRIGKEIGQ